MQVINDRWAKSTKTCETRQAEALMQGPTPQGPLTPRWGPLVFA